MRKTLLFCIMISCTFIYAQPPYWGTIFIDPDIIKPSDPSAIESTIYRGQGTVTMYDRRVSDWVDVNAYLFDVTWDDGLTSKVQVNSEFGSLYFAKIEAEKYAFLIGQLPHCLREDVDEIWIHKGEELFGGGNNSILIHTGQSINYENEGIIEETLVHEACHTSLDAGHANTFLWRSAQDADNEFISTYAKDYPAREDFAESILTWLAVRYRKDYISAEDYIKITQAIPNRLNYFDLIDCDLYPFPENLLSSLKKLKTPNFKIYPNPTTDFIYLDSDEINGDEIKIFNLLGENLTNRISYEDGRLNVAKLPTGYYFLKIKTFATKIFKQ